MGSMAGGYLDIPKKKILIDVSTLIEIKTNLVTQI
jgi:hypothetical protein